MRIVKGTLSASWPLLQGLPLCDMPNVVQFARYAVLSVSSLAGVLLRFWDLQAHRLMRVWPYQASGRNEDISDAQVPMQDPVCASDGKFLLSAT